MRITSPTRRRFLELIAAVSAIHIVAIAVYYGLDVPLRPERTQRLFAWAWMGLTVTSVLVGLQRIKRARRR